MQERDEDLADDPTADRPEGQPVGHYLGFPQNVEPEWRGLVEARPNPRRLLRSAFERAGTLMLPGDALAGRDLQVM